MYIRKLANAFCEGAKPIKALSKVTPPAVMRYKTKHGGLWVGGNVEISDDRLVFRPNDINRTMHEALQDIIIDTSKITAVNYQFGWITGIVAITHDRGEFRFRCFGAKAVVNELSAYIEKL